MMLYRLLAIGSVLCCLHIAVITSVVAQELSEQTILFGPYVEGGGGITIAATPLPVYPLSPDCGTFSTTGNGSILEAGFSFSLPGIFSERFGFGGRLGIGIVNQGFDGVPLDPQRIFDSLTSTLITLDREFQFRTSATHLSFDLLLSYQLNRSFHLEAGPSVGYRLGTDFDQSDNVNGPGDIRFDDGQASHTMAIGIDTAVQLLRLGAGIGLAYQTKLSPSLLLVPSLRLDADVLSPAAEASWLTLRGSGSLGILFDFTPKPPPPSLPPTSPEFPPQPVIPPPTASINIIGVDDDGNESDVSRIQATEVLHKRRLPLLGQLFYEQESSDLPDRYVMEADEEKRHEWELMDAYHHLPGILATRMKEHPDGMISLSGIGSTDEPDGIARERIKAFRSFLASHGIANNRIEEREVTSIRSDESRNEGKEENRRIEITTSDSLLISPLIIEVIERDFSPPSIRVMPAFNSPVGIADWEMSVAQNENVMATYSRNDQDEGISPDFQWRIEQRRGDTLLAPLVARINVTDSLGRTATAFDTIPLLLVQKKQEVDGDLEIGINRLRRSSWLIGFPYDSDQLTPEVIGELKRTMEFVEPASSITITGFTDRTGEAQHNRELSQRRADNVAEWIRAYLDKHGIAVEEISSSGAGVDNRYFDNDLPEGRVLSRSVLLRIDLDAAEADLP